MHWVNGSYRNTDLALPYSLRNALPDHSRVSTAAGKQTNELETT